MCFEPQIHLGCDSEGPRDYARPILHQSVFLQLLPSTFSVSCRLGCQQFAVDSHACRRRFRLVHLLMTFRIFSSFYIVFFHASPPRP